MMMMIVCKKREREEKGWLFLKPSLHNLSPWGLFEFRVTSDGSGGGCTRLSFSSQFSETGLQTLSHSPDRP
jgi:hypothetical protein